MTAFLIVRYFHFIGILVLFSAVFAELVIMQKSISNLTLRRLSIIDAIYGISAVVVLAAGFLLWFVWGKAAAFYSNNPIFWLKIGLFTVVGILSAWPTIFILKNRKRHNEADIKVPTYILHIIKIELLLLLLIPLLAVLIAQGIGNY